MRILLSSLAQKDSAPYYIRAVLEFPETGPPDRL